MAITAVISGVGAPGVSTTVAALATAWPGPVLAIDADPSTGALVPGWLSRWWVDGRVSAQRGVVSFAASTRRMSSVPAEGLAGHVQEIPHARHVRLLAGVAHREQATAIGAEGWSRLASAARDLTHGTGPDVLVDAGRWCPQTPWPLLAEADRVLLAVRPRLRHLAGSADLATYLRDRFTTVELAVLAATTREARDTAAALKSPIGLVLPDDVLSARVFSDGIPAPTHVNRRPLWKATRRVVRALHRQAHTSVRFDHDSTDIMQAGTR